MSTKKKPVKDIKNLSKKTKKAVQKIASSEKSSDSASFMEELLVDNYSEIKKKKESK